MIRKHGELTVARAEQIPLATFDQLQAGDVVFVDTSHVVGIGGDVNFLVLEALPRVAPGVLVHLHDIFLPYEYPRRWIEDERRPYTEQYLVHAFLAFNERFEVVFPVHAIARRHPDRLAAVITSFAPPRRGAGAFWIRRL